MLEASNNNELPVIPGKRYFTIGEVSEMISRTLRFYPNIDANDIRAVLVQAGDRILPELPEKLGRYAERILTDRNVEVLLNARVASATADAVYLDDGSRIETCLHGHLPSRERSSPVMSWHHSIIGLSAGGRGNRKFKLPFRHHR